MLISQRSKMSIITKCMSYHGANGRLVITGGGGGGGTLSVFLTTYYIYWPKAQVYIYILCQVSLYEWNVNFSGGNHSEAMSTIITYNAFNKACYPFFEIMSVFKEKTGMVWYNSLLHLSCQLNNCPKVPFYFQITAA